MPVSEIFVQGTDTDPAVPRAGSHETRGRLRAKLADLTAGESPEAGDWVDFGLEELRPYLAGAERDLYAQASRHGETHLLGEALRAAALVVNGLIDDLAAAAGSGDAARIGMMLAGAVEVHLELEEKLLVPMLAAEPDIIDVRRIARGGRHPRVFFRYERLLAGEAFVLVHSHDPLPLRREFETMHPGAFTWDYLMTGPEEWRVRIGRIAVDG